MHVTFILFFFLWTFFFSFSTVLSTPSPEQELLLPSDLTGYAHFGSSISLFGDDLVIGAPDDNENGFSSGAVYVFGYVGHSWSERGKFLSSDGIDGDKFGTSVSVYESTLAVGAVNKARIGQDLPQAGAVYIFLRHESGWSETQKLLSNDGGKYDHFGIALCLSLNGIVVGSADHEVSVGNSSGSAYFFTRSSFGENFIQVDEVNAPDAANGDKFGFALDMFYESVVIGAYQDDDKGSRSGSVYVYDIVADSLTFRQKIVPADGDQNDAFGFSLSIYENFLAVSSFLNDDGGSVYIFSRDDASSAWSAQAKLIDDDASGNEKFGFAVALTNNELVVGSVGAMSGAGKATVFQDSGDGIWIPKWVIIAADGNSGDSLGYAVAIEGKNIILSAPKNDDDNNIDSGSVYFALNADAPTSGPTLSLHPSLLPSALPSSVPSSSKPSAVPSTQFPSTPPSDIPLSSYPSPESTLAPSIASAMETTDDDVTTVLSQTDLLIICLGCSLGSCLAFCVCTSGKKYYGEYFLNRLRPIETEAQVIEQDTSSLELPHIASVYAIEPLTPKSKKNRSNSVAPLPFATCVGEGALVIE